METNTVKGYYGSENTNCLIFTAEHEYFEYMVESYVNGQIRQCKDLFMAMSKEDKKRFIEWFSRNENCTMDLDECYLFYRDLAIK